jgi:serine/threonine-protein phosphatase 2A regulatory subunit B'
MQKLDQCNVIFDFRDPSMDIRSKEIKRSTLQELLEYISNNRNVIQPPMYGKIVYMVSPDFFPLNLTLVCNQSFPPHSSPLKSNWRHI